MSSKKGYPLVGGPLSGCFAREADFHQPHRVHSWNCKNGIGVGPYTGLKEGDIWPGGAYAAYANEYVGLNRASSHSKVPSRIWLHVSILRAAGVPI